MDLQATFTYPRGGAGTGSRAHHLPKAQEPTQTPPSKSVRSVAGSSYGRVRCSQPGPQGPIAVSLWLHAVCWSLEPQPSRAPASGQWFSGSAGPSHGPSHSSPSSASSPCQAGGDIRPQGGLRGLRGPLTKGGAHCSCGHRQSRQPPVRGLASRKKPRWAVGSRGVAGPGRHWAGAGQAGCTRGPRRALHSSAWGRQAGARGMHRGAVELRGVVLHFQISNVLSKFY